MKRLLGDSGHPDDQIGGEGEHEAASGAIIEREKESERVRDKDIADRKK